MILVGVCTRGDHGRQAQANKQQCSQHSTTKLTWLLYSHVFVAILANVEMFPNVFFPISCASFVFMSIYGT